MIRSMLERSALYRVNYVRSQVGEEPIGRFPNQNDQGNDSECVIANAFPSVLRTYVDGDGIRIVREDEARSKVYCHSPGSLLFMFAFDLGLYPEYGNDEYVPFSSVMDKVLIEAFDRWNLVVFGPTAQAIQRQRQRAIGLSMWTGHQIKKHGPKVIKAAERVDEYRKARRLARAERLVLANMEASVEKTPEVESESVLTRA